MDIDFYLFQIVNNWAGQYAWLDSLGIFFAKYFEYALVFCLFFFLVKNFKRYWPMVWQAILAGILSRLVFTEIIRWILPKARPFIDNDVNLLLTHAPTSAFPSGHAAFYFALSTIIYFYNKRAGILFFIASFLICLARVFCGIHWPLDIFAGAVIGVFSSWLIIKIFKK
ncbi:phosphatase PAP2 family protein [Candidatus Parcubacteria bacterium]|nr:phosphatase PAP2 family protein [Candidatus Parcubacteria bacterium]